MPSAPRLGSSSVMKKLLKSGSDDFSHMMQQMKEFNLGRVGEYAVVDDCLGGYRRHNSVGSEYDFLERQQPGEMGVDAKKVHLDAESRGEEDAKREQRGEADGDQLSIEETYSRISSLGGAMQSESLSSSESTSSAVADCFGGSEGADPEENIPVAMPVLMDPSLMESTSQLPASTPLPHKIVSENFMQDLEKWKTSKIFSRSHSDKYGERKARRRVSFSETVEVFLYEAEKMKKK